MQKSALRFGPPADHARTVNDFIVLYCIVKNQWSVGSKSRLYREHLEASGRTDGHDRLQYFARYTVGKYQTNQKVRKPSIQVASNTLILVYREVSAGYWFTASNDPGGRFAKYLTIYHKIIVSLS